MRALSTLFTNFFKIFLFFYNKKALPAIELVGLN
nr:MAG TPA: hypothetical protein [Caudoviricetes sp.]